MEDPYSAPPAGGGAASLIWEVLIKDDLGKEQERQAPGKASGSRKELQQVLEKQRWENYMPFLDN